MKNKITFRKTSWSCFEDYHLCLNGTRVQPKFIVRKAKTVSNEHYSVDYYLVTNSHKHHRELTRVGEEKIDTLINAKNFLAEFYVKNFLVGK